ncbi:MAG TPA: ABC transporter ATP-binding protein [Nocardioidaceae bacterium]|nr:ABC transporter ATP-binding protein [Nocardioidaceae bacterium]
MTVAQIKDAAVELGGRPVLRGIDLTISAGEVVAVLGANGSGKSTLIRALLGLVPTVRGSVELFGTPLSRFKEHHRVGFVPQRVTAAAGVPASVHEVVSSGRLSRRRFGAPISRTDREVIRAAIEAVELSDRTHDSVSTLSGGQQQRVLIARALAGQPELLVLDEPTSGVDLLSQQTFAEVLHTLIDRGITIVLVAHEMGPIEPLVSRTVVMRDGRIAYDGAPLASFHEAQHHHGHHHPELEQRADYTPGVATPWDGRSPR